jgi:hypothetical protein
MIIGGFRYSFEPGLEIADIYYTDKVGGGNRRLPREIILEYVWK